MCSNKEFTDGTSAYDSTTDDMLTNDSSYLTGESDTFSQRKQPADILSGILRELQLSDWEIRSAELEIMKHPDGSNVILGAGAFGQVFKAKWNGVQTVAAKQLIQSTSDKAKTDFLRERIPRLSCHGSTLMSNDWAGCLLMLLFECMLQLDRKWCMQFCRHAVNNTRAVAMPGGSMQCFFKLMCMVARR